MLIDSEKLKAEIETLKAKYSSEINWNVAMDCVLVRVENLESESQVGEKYICVNCEKEIMPEEPYGEDSYAVRRWHKVCPAPPEVPEVKE